MLKEIFYQFNPWWEGDFKAPGIVRKKYVNELISEMKNDSVKVITGLRRVGKTTIIKQTISNLLETIDPKTILFLSMEHPAFDNATILEIVRNFRKINSLERKIRIYLFLDEIQYKQDFQREIKILHDNENAKIILSGSNSLILADKRAYLTGRSKRMLIEPLDFEEFLEFRGLKAKKAEEYLLERWFDDYLKTGGMPEFVLSGDEERLISLVDDIIYKDIAARRGVRNVAKLRELFILLCERVGKRMSYNKLARILGVKVDTVIDYVSYFRETYLIYTVGRCARSLNERVKSPKKIYIADSGIRNIFTGLRDKGALFENLVFLLLKENNPCYYYENGKEIDFIVNKTAIECKYSKKPDVDRENILENTPFKKGMVISSYTDIKKLMSEMQRE
ncbi:MAG: ATP-binding protein [Candidatus Micrarchaeota archaeon]|nr:ATP-binding protein [Candidatus Micrarchaeota archaeon]